MLHVCPKQSRLLSLQKALRSAPICSARPRNTHLQDLPEERASRIPFHVAAWTARPLTGRSASANHARRRHGPRVAGAASGSGDGNRAIPGALTLELRLAKFCQWFTQMFPLWIMFVSVLALWHPESFTWFRPQYMPACLALVMLGMGLTMTLEQVLDVLVKRWYLVAIGAALQFTIMPGLGYLIFKFWGLDQGLAVGTALVACCPGGTSSNIVTYIARGDVPLSIIMTTLNTFLAMAITPVLTGVEVGALVHVDALGMFLSTLQVVLLPVLMGAALNRYNPELAKRAAQFSPAMSTAITAMMNGITLGVNSVAAKAAGLALVGAVGALHAGGFVLGYLCSRALGLSEKVCRTNSIEVGMQSSSLGVVLAVAHFSNPLVAAPSAISAICHAMMGSTLAAWWRTKPSADDAPENGRAATRAAPSAL